MQSDEFAISKVLNIRLADSCLVNEKLEATVPVCLGQASDHAHVAVSRDVIHWDRVPMVLQWLVSWRRGVYPLQQLVQQLVRFAHHAPCDYRA